MYFVTKAMPMHRKLHYISKCNKLVQLVVQVQYNMNVIYSLRGTHTHACTHTDVADKSNFKKPGNSTQLISKVGFLFKTVFLLI